MMILDDDILNEDGSNKAFMLSELIKMATDALEKHGNMRVWVNTLSCGGHRNIEQIYPVTMFPWVDDTNLSEKHYWGDEDSIKSFVLGGGGP